MLRIVTWRLAIFKIFSQILFTVQIGDLCALLNREVSSATSPFFFLASLCDGGIIGYTCLWNDFAVSYNMLDVAYGERCLLGPLLALKCCHRGKGLSHFGYQEFYSKSRQE